MFLKHKSLTPNELKIIQDKGTEAPFSSKMSEKLKGTYICRQCGLALFRSHTKFNSGCGWPSFDEEIPNSLSFHKDADGRRTEIVCARCDGHLGHVFTGEGFTTKNIRHCVNSISIEFVDDLKITDTREALFAAGCFWGVEYYFKKLSGVLKTQVGYIGGNTSSPTYEQVCQKNTGHLEGIRIVYDPTLLNYDKCVQYFFEIHDPTHAYGQGPDIGPQYLSGVFYNSEEEKETAKKAIEFLSDQGLNIATKLYPATVFWPAEDYHQDYYEKTGHTPYCHVYTKRF